MVQAGLRRAATNVLDSFSTCINVIKISSTSSWAYIR